MTQITTPDAVKFQGNPPRRSNPGDAGADLIITEDVTLQPGQRVTVGTGTRIRTPDGWVTFLTPRSGLAKNNGITVLNAPGTVDAGYTGEIRAIIINHGEETFIAKAGDRIVQAVILPCFTGGFVQGDVDGARGDAGFGSTGRGGEGEGWGV